MNISHSNLRNTLLNAALLTAVSHVPLASAAPLYWDVNGSSPGSGNAGGFWETGLGNWNTVADGTGSSGLFANGDNAIFSAGADGVGTFTVNINGTVATPLIQLEEAGLVTLAGGTIDITGGSTFNTASHGVTTGKSLTWNPIIAGTGNLTLAVHGDATATGGGSNTIFTLSGANTFTGDVVVTSGVVGYTSNFGNAANKIVLNGGGIVNNTTGTLARNIEAGASGGVLRNYGNITTTHTGVLSGSGTFRRTDNGDFVVTQTATHTGPWAIQRGMLTVGDATQTTDLIASSGVITIGEAGGAATLRYRLNSNLNWNTPASDLVFGNAGSVLAWHPNLSAQTMTINNATSFTDPALGVLQVRNGEIRLASGANVQVGTLSVTNANPADGRLAVETGASVTTRYLTTGDANNTTGTVNQTGGTLTVQSGGTGIRIGHWTNGTNPGNIYNLSGGTLDATALSANAGEARWVNVGWDGQATMTVGGTGILKAAGIRLDRNRAGSANFASTLTVNPGGLVEVGSLGIEGQGTNDAVVLAGGTLKATATSTWGAILSATAATNTTLNVDGFIPRIANSANGSGTVTVTDTFGGGFLELDSGTGTRTWTPVLAGSTNLTKVGAGTLTLASSNTNTGTFLVSQGTLNLTGDVDAPLLDINDGATLAGEGATSGNLALGFSTGGNMSFNPNTAGSFTVNGDVALNGISNLLPTTPFNGTKTVLTYTGTLTGNASNLALPNAASYRSTNITAAAGSISLTISNEDLVWTGPGAWDLNTTTGWTDAGMATDNFFFGDNVRFDDSALTTAVTITGILQPGLMTVDSTAPQNFTWTGDATNYIAGNGSLLKKGTSILTMNAPNTFTGGTTISNGQINLRNNTALGTGTVTLGDASTGTSNIALYLDTNRVNFGTPVVVSNNGTGTATLGSLASVTGTGDNNQFTNITLQRGVIFDSNAADRTDYENITGTGSVTVQGTGRSIFPTDGASWVGDLTVSTTGAGSLQVGVASTAGNRIPDASNLTISSGAVVNLSTTAETISGLNGAGTFGSNSPSGGTGTLTVGFGGASGSFSGVINGSTAGNIIALTKIGAGTQILSGNSTYSGATAINGGTVQVGNGAGSGDLGTGAVALAAGTTLTYNRTGAVIQEGALNSATTASGILNVNGDATTAVTLNAGGNFGGVVNLNAGSLIFGVTNPTGTAAGAATFNLAAGTTLSNLGAATHGHFGALNLTGGATVTTGSGTGSYNGENYQLNGNVTVSGGSTAAVITREGTRTNANSGLALGILNGAKTFTVADVTGTPAADLIVSTELENPDNGVGALTKAGPGTMQLANAIAHSYTGTTTVSAGTLLASGSIVGPLTVDAGATVAPGASAGSFATGSATINGSYACEIDGLTRDTLAVTGDLTLGAGSTLALATLGGGATEASYVIATYTGTRTGTFTNVSGLPGGYSVVYNDTLKQIELNQTGGNPYASWESANGISGAGSGFDSDGDGIANGIEFVIGGDPSGPNSNSSALLPTITTDATYLNFTYRRTDDVQGLPAAQQPYVEYSSSLGSWTEAEAGVNGVIIDEVNGSPDLVTVRIPLSLAVGTKLFARLRADIP